MGVLALALEFEHQSYMLATFLQLIRQEYLATVYSTQVGSNLWFSFREDVTLLHISLHHPHADILGQLLLLRSHHRPGFSYVPLGSHPNFGWFNAFR